MSRRMLREGRAQLGRPTLEGPCPSCGLTTILDPAQRKSSHEFPECKWWLQALARAGGNPVETVEVLVDGALVPIANKA
jgi:hypothetical protein